MMRPLRPVLFFIAVYISSMGGAAFGLTPASPASVPIPGPLRSFLRMAGISQEAPLEQVLPLLARNAYLQGYQIGRPTEYLLLLQRYVQQAQELEILAGAKAVIHVTNCDDAGTLLHILGYRPLDGCSEKHVILSTADPERAFLTIDSGFPLTTLEADLQKGVPFDYPYPSTQAPILLRESDWTAFGVRKREAGGGLLDVLLRDPAVDRLYWAVSKMEANTVHSLLRAEGLQGLLNYGPLLDFYGSQLNTVDGRLIVPGGKEAEDAWENLVGISPEKPGDFIYALLSRDNGWLAAYFDALERVSQSQQAHLTEGPRLRNVYEAFHAPSPGTNAANGVFRRAPGLLVLLTRVEWEPNGDPHVPGDLAAWREILNEHRVMKDIHGAYRHARRIDHPDELLEAMAGLSRTEIDDGPLQSYLTLSAIDSGRPRERRLEPRTVRLLASNFSREGNWYLIFSEFPALSDDSITHFIAATNAISRISNQTLRGNAMGAFQAGVGLWQILARQGEIPASAIDASWQKLIEPFAKIGSATQLFDATRASLSGMLKYTSSGETPSQSGIIELLAGPAQTSDDGKSIHDELAARMRSVLDDQQLVSLDTLFALSDDLHAMAQGAHAAPDMLELASELREFEMPRPIFTSSERISWSPRVYTSHHAAL
ncbi:MAG: hypothetical protein FWD64_10475, partial [Acidobacteriaceae bacterium]|nr:hypothetical protein [Acidobacteriaceae bacterium]